MSRILGRSETSGRDDDNAAVFEKRFVVFEQETKGKSKHQFYFYFYLFCLKRELVILYYKSPLPSPSLKVKHSRTHCLSFFFFFFFFFFFGLDVVAEYDKKGLVRRVDATRSVDEVFKDVSDLFQTF